MEKEPLLLFLSETWALAKSQFHTDVSPGAGSQAQKALFFRIKHACLSVSPHWPLRNGVCSCLPSVHD